MKKWALHNIACYTNALSVTALLILFLKDVLRDPVDTKLHSDDILILGLVFLIFFIFLLSDYWGLKLFFRYKKRDHLSFSDKAKASISLVLLFLLEIPTAYAAWKAINHFYLSITHNEGISKHGDINGLLVLVIFLSSLIILITTNLLLGELRIVKAETKEEIDNIGSDSY